MSYNPISGFALQVIKDNGQVAADYYLKFYEANSTTPLSMATDASGAVLLSKAKINDQGMPISNPLDNTTVFIPYLNKNYRLVVYTSEADADANNTAAAFVNIASVELSASAGDITANGGYLEYGGTANTITLTNDSGSPSAYSVGQLFRFRATATNTGAVTINVNGAGAKSAVTIDGSALPTSYLATDKDTTVTYDGTNFVVYPPVQSGETDFTVSRLVTTDSHKKYVDLQTFTHNTVAAAKADTSLALFDRVRTAGYYSKYPEGRVTYSGTNLMPSPFDPSGWTGVGDSDVSYRGITEANPSGEPVVGEFEYVGTGTAPINYSLNNDATIGDKYYICLLIKAESGTQLGFRFSFQEGATTYAAGTVSAVTGNYSIIGSPPVQVRTQALSDGYILAQIEYVSEYNVSNNFDIFTQFYKVSDAGAQITLPSVGDKIKVQAAYFGKNTDWPATVLEAGEYPSGEGGAEYIVVAGGTGTDDGGSYHDMANGLQLQLVISGAVNVRQFGAIADGVTDNKTIFSNAFAACDNLFIPAGQYYVSGEGATLTHGGITIEGEQGTELLAERTYYLADTPSAGKYVVGQGNVINGEGLTGQITLRNITVVGVYNETWGNQSMANGSVPYGDTNKLLFIYNCENVTLDNVTVRNSFSSNMTLGAGGWGDDVVEKYGYNAILVSSCQHVKLLSCNGIRSCGEAWHVYGCDKVDVAGCLFENDYGVSYLDVTFCNNFNITNNRFRKLLASDSGELLNVASSNGTISGNEVLNGNIDIGNEYINRGASLPLAKTFVLHDQVVCNNTLYNGHIAMSTQGNATDITDWVQESVVIANNIVTVDLDTRPSADGFTVLNYSGVVLPAYHDARNISVLDNTIILKGALQTAGANPHLYNRIRLINCLIEGTGVLREGVTISGNRIDVDLSNYDPDDINDLSGAILFDGGSWTDVVIENNMINSELGMYIGEFDAINRMTIRDNELNSEFFLNVPWMAPSAFDIDGFDVSNNKFTFLNTAGHTYTTTEAEEKGFGYFVNMRIGGTSSVQNMTVKGNKAVCPAFVVVSNFQTTTSSLVEVFVEDNKVEFVDYGAGSLTYYPSYIGRTTGSQTPNGVARFVNNYFSESSASTVNFNVRECMAFELLGNMFIGAFDITVQADSTVAGVPESRLILMNNVATVAFDIAVLNLDGSANTIVNVNNTNITYS